MFNGYIASGSHSLTLQVTNKAGYANTGVVQVNVAGNPEPPPPPPPGGGEPTNGQWRNSTVSTSTWCWFQNVDGNWYNTGKCWQV